MSNCREGLAEAWIDAKRREQKANADRLKIESEIIDLVNPSRGTSYIDLDDGSAVKIYVGSDTEWNQDAVFALRESWKEISPDVAFPFRDELKPDSRVMGLIRDHRPDLWTKFLEPASRTKDRKPSFSVR